MLLIEFIGINPSIVKDAMRKVRSAMQSSNKSVTFIEYSPKSARATNFEGLDVGIVMLTTDVGASVADADLVCRALSKAMPGYALYMPRDPLQKIQL